ncbi:amino acid/amide ABC transporter membrane protein 2, HAAT family [Albimonas pacifica]|uniref:Amino acid/amide ABC transporter membrane protein 2, HAAT family n=2 Tax=Albimonas pacifica TaxID=1114924 RepID=A0A1I3JRG2_9RHOB|nr:amino acid/amide ABC transporter membrane protein 2, HAAT family [Albimonas pacifica]
MAMSDETMTGGASGSAKAAPVPKGRAAAAGGKSTLGQAVFVILLLGALALPFIFKNFTIFQMTMLMVYAIAILGLNLLTGINGQFSLGHGAFYAVGAYTAAIMMENLGIGYVWTLPVAGILCFVVGFLFGLPALRLEGIYLALATFALAVATPQFLKLTPFEHWTGGVQGIVIIKPDAPFGLDAVLNADQWLYFFTLAVGLFLYWLARNLVRSRTGRALMAIRDNPIAARSMGVNTSVYKATAFGISAMFTGIAGCLGAIVIQFVAPDSFTFALSVAILVGLVIGGVGWLPGALLGAAFIVFIPNVAEEISKGLAGAFYGFFLIAVIYLAPQGAGGLLRALVAKLGR